MAALDFPKASGYSFFHIYNSPFFQLHPQRGPVGWFHCAPIHVSLGTCFDSLASAP